MKGIVKRFTLWLMMIIVVSIGFLHVDSVHAAPVQGDDFPMYGKDLYRTRYVQDQEMKPPIKFKGVFNLGWSVSQSIAVGDFFYVTAAVADTNNLFDLAPGVYFYKLPTDFPFFKPSDSKTYIRQKLIEKGAKVVKLRSGFTKTYSHPVWSESNQRFYVAGGDNIYCLTSELSVVNYYQTNANIVGPPTVYPNDVMIIGDFNTRIHVVKGLSNSGTLRVTTYIADTEDSSGEISGSTTGLNLSGDFVVGVNYRGKYKQGPLYRFKIQFNQQQPILQFTWKFNAANGITSNAIYENGYLYVSSKSGHVYKINATTGKEVWGTTIPDVILINNSPAINSHYVYFPVRNPGKIVAINKSDGSIEFSAAQGKDRSGNKVDSNLEVGQDVANDLTTWKTKDGREIVFYGDTSGQMIFLTANGNRTPVAMDYQSQTLTRSSIKATSNDGVPWSWQIQGQGLAAEPMIAKKHLVFGVNTSDSMGQVWFYSIGSIDDVYVKSIQGGNYQYGSNVLTEVVVGSKDFSTDVLTPVVRFYRDGTLIEEKRVRLNKGEEKQIYFFWKAVGNKNGQLKATINLDPSEFDETDYTNNTKTASYSLNGGLTKDLCTPSDRFERAISKVEYVCGEYGCYPIYYYEYLIENSTPANPSKIRAGYGFTFDSYALYVDEANMYTGPKKSVVSFNTELIPNYVQNDVSLEKTNTNTSSSPYYELTEWKLPFIHVEEYSGHLFYDSNHPKRDPKDFLLNGGRKWYTDFKEKDGEYYYKVVAQQAGKNNLKSCNTYKVDIKGTPFEDYVRRDVDPRRPFIDDKIGFNWKNKISIILDMIPFYEGDDTSHENSYRAESDKINEWRREEKKQYNKSEAVEFIKENEY